MTTTINPEVYRTAATIIRTGGLAQGTYRDDDGAHCTLGAVMEALELETFHPDYLALLQEVDTYARPVADLLGDQRSGQFMGWSLVSGWNDREGRTAEDVIGVLEQAAEKVEAEL